MNLPYGDPLDACDLPLVWPPQQQRLPMVGGVVQAQRLVVPTQVIRGLKSYRHACRLAWKLRQIRNLTKRGLAEQAGLYASHVTDYFSPHETRRELPARCVAVVESVLGNTVISQYLNWQARLTTLEELQAVRLAA